MNALANSRVVRGIRVERLDDTELRVLPGSDPVIPVVQVVKAQSLALRDCLAASRSFRNGNDRVENEIPFPHCDRRAGQHVDVRGKRLRLRLEDSQSITSVI